MKDVFLKLFKRIIRESNCTNTYKMAWAKALVEISMENTDLDLRVNISLRQMAIKIIKYYWNQTIFFDLIQGSNLIETPVLVQYVKQLIEQYFISVDSQKPERFERIEEYIQNNLYTEFEQCIEKTIKTLKKDVSWRFVFIDGKYYNSLYDYNKGDDYLVILKENLDVLKENYEDLFDLINYRWGLVLERFNSSPRINKKVRIIDEQDIKRNSLTKFKEYLDLENPERRCFICNNIILDNELSIDHVIPWSYLYSDDLWNLVYVHRGCNSGKSNVIPSLNEINKLKNRNEKLINIMKKMNKNGKIYNELKLARDKDYVHKFWIACKG